MPLRHERPARSRPRRPRGRRVLIALLVAVAFGLAWVLPFGPPFPWSPWKPGYQHLWIQARGRDAFQRLLLAAMEAPGEYVGLFEQVYGLSLETAAADFTAALRTRRWVPEP